MLYSYQTTSESGDGMEEKNTIPEIHLEAMAAGLDMTYEEAAHSIPIGRYRHFKGKEYEVIAIARHSETSEPMVIYKALYGEGGIWVRPANMWNETVERDGKTYKRFAPMNEKTVVNDKKRASEAEALVDHLTGSQKYYFSDLKPSDLQERAGVYAIFDSETGENLYVGRTKNLRQRLYNNHLMGPKSNARLKKYLTEDPLMTEISTMEEAKLFLKDRCYFQFLLVDDVRQRGQIEGMLGFFLDVRYIHEEH